MTDDDAPTGEAPGPEWFQRVADNSGLVFFILRIKPDVSFEFVNGGMRTQLVGQRPDSSPADSRMLLDQLDPDSASDFDVLFAMPPGETRRVDLKWRHISGRPVYSRGWVTCTERPDGTVVLEGAMQDITELHGVERELRNSEERHRLLAHNAWDVVWTMGLDGSITYVSPAVQRVRGFTPEEAMHQSLDEINPPDSAARVADYFQRVFGAVAAGTDPPEFRGEIEYYRKDGSIMIGELQVIPHLDADGHVLELLGVTRDISERKRFEAELTELAVTDPLTGLWNRRRASQLLSDELAQAEHHGTALTVLMVDIDHFKEINDNFGHQTGDGVLIEVARRLREQVRGTDLVGRWGGEEFVILLRFCALRDGLAAAEKLRSRIADIPFVSPASVSVSIGAAERRPGEDLAAWLARADAALYRAKRAGRNAVVAG